VVEDPLKHQIVEALQRRYPQQLDKTDDLLDLVWRHGTLLDALMYRELFWPEFVEIDGMVFWRGQTYEEDAERIRTTLASKNGDRTATEQSYNYVEIPPLFGNPDPSGDTSDEMDDDLVRSLVEMWHAKLRNAYPNRNFVVEFVPADAGANVGLLFYELHG
jgi:hypothetical protein